MPEQPKPLREGLDDLEGEWQELVDSIDATDIPVNMLKVLRVHIDEDTRFVFPIKDWLDEGVPIAKIEKVVNDYYLKHSDDILGSDFIVDLDKLKTTVKAETKKALKNL